MPSNRSPRQQYQNDIIILVIGPTGAGKSTFINCAVGEEVARVGGTLRSCTTQIQDIDIPCPGGDSRRLVFIDTPGFDDTIDKFMGDTETSRCIADWLRKTYGEKKKASGIIYLHEITQTRMLNSLRRNYLIFAKLCGIYAASSTILVTTKWDRVTLDEGEERENQLHQEFWQVLFKGGSSTARFSHTPESESTSQIVNLIVDMVNGGDIIIPVIGLTGVGKSKFINTAAGRDVARVGHGLLPSTADIQIIPVSDPRIGHRRIILIDTPGFGQPHVRDTEILKRIETWLQNTYHDKKTLTGIIYLWDVSQAREKAVHFLDILFCGPHPPLNVVVVTTKRGAPPTSDEGGRYTELQESLMKSDVVQFTGELDSAWGIIDRIIQRDSFDVERSQVLLSRIRLYSQKRSSLAVEFLALLKKLLLRRS